MEKLVVFLVIIVLMMGLNLDASAKNKTKEDMVLVESFFSITNDASEYKYEADSFHGLMEGKMIFSKDKLNLSLADSICRGQAKCNGIKVYSPRQKKIQAKINTKIYRYAYAISFRTKGSYNENGYPTCVIIEYFLEGKSYHLNISPGGLI